MAQRPGVITFIGVIMLIQATLNIVAGVMLLALNTQQRIIDETGLSSSELVTSGVVALVVGAIILLVTLALLAGSRVARVLVTIVQVIAVAGAAWGMFAHHTGAWLFSGLLQVGIAIFVLWALYNEKADAYYAKS
jgi:hypothetical protein